MSQLKQWDKILQSREWGRWPNEDIVRAVCRHVPKEQRRQAVDLGCGGGAHTCMLVESGWFTHAIDGTTFALAQTEQLGQDRGTNGSCVALRECNFETDYQTLGEEFSVAQVVVDSFTLCCLNLRGFEGVLRQLSIYLPAGSLFVSQSFVSDPGRDDTPAPHLRNEVQWLARLRGWASVRFHVHMRPDGVEIMHIEAVR